MIASDASARDRGVVAAGVATCSPCSIGSAPSASTIF